MLDPVIHAPARLRIVATLAALPEGDALWSIRLQDMVGLTEGSLRTCLGELADAGYLACKTTGNDGARTVVALTPKGRDALVRYTALLRHQLAGPARHQRVAPASQIRVGDADRDAATAALAEHFAHGQLTFDEFNARLGAALAATTQGELARATEDLPEVSVVSAWVSFSRGKKRRPGHPPGPGPGGGALPRRRFRTGNESP